jgi:hypothetical protein
MKRSPGVLFGIENPSIHDDTALAVTIWQILGERGGA